MEAVAPVRLFLFNGKSTYGGLHRRLLALRAKSQALQNHS
jgi:hypothetical protein